MKRSTNLVFGLLHVFALSALAVAQPVLDLLARHSEFFVARHSKPLDILLLVALLVFLVPAGLCVLELIALGLNSRLHRFLHNGIVAFLASVVVLQALNHTEWLQGLTPVFASITLGFVFAVVYDRIGPVRTFSTVLGSGILLIPLLFLANDSVSILVFPGTTGADIDLNIRAPRPVVMVVFDELPLISILDENRDINSGLYPGFAALAKDSRWFKNATTVAEHTLDAVPALLTGCYPEGQRKTLPTALDHPNNLFTLLGDEFGFGNANELMTSLCPESLCTNYRWRNVSLRSRMSSLLADVSVVYLHILFPDSLRSHLPAINRDWQGFLSNSTVAPPTRRDAVEQLPMPVADEHWLRRLLGPLPGWYLDFLSGIQPSDRPQVHFTHVMLPHQPWVYMPSGVQYSTSPKFIHGLKADDTWEKSDTSTVYAYQRHMLQLGFVDGLVRELIARLKTVGIYEEALVIVTSDHGASFNPGDKRRLVTETNFDEILAVPLFIKFPNNDFQGVDERFVELVDVLPTVLEVIGADASPLLDGRSLLDPHYLGRDRKSVFKFSERREVSFDSERVAAFPGLARKLGWFGAGQNALQIFQIGPYPDLIGQAVTGYPQGGDAQLTVELQQERALLEVASNTGFVPLQLVGQVKAEGDVDKRIDLAFSVNGSILAVSRIPTVSGETGVPFSVLLPDAALIEGRNDIRVYRVKRSRAGQLSLHPTSRTENVGYELTMQQNNAVILSSSGETWTVGNGGILGEVNSIEAKNATGSARFSGWAVDRHSDSSARLVLLFCNGQFVAGVRPSEISEEIADAFGKPEYRRSGFVFQLPINMLGSEDVLEVRLFAISDGGAALEMKYPREMTTISFSRQGWGIKENQPPREYSPGNTKASFYSLISTRGHEQISAIDGQRIEVVPGSLRGHLDSVTIDAQKAVLIGWAIDLEGGGRVDRVVIFVDGAGWHETGTSRGRPDVSQFFGSDAFESSGFHVVLSKARLDSVADQEIRLFALSADGRASELFYPDGWEGTLSANAVK